MRANRQDAWTKDEDELLANTVIDYIKNGYTQLESFRYVAEKLNRTAAACGFRWNATIRKRYTKEIERAKQMRKKLHYNSLAEQSYQSGKNQPKTISTLDQAIHWLEKVKDESNDQSFQVAGKLNNQIIEENKQLSEELTLHKTLIKNIKEQIKAIE